jgi:hypothetical protein
MRSEEGTVASLKLISLTCVRKMDVIGTDEPYIEVTADEGEADFVWNGVMTKGDTDNLQPLAIPFDESVDVRLKEKNGKDNFRQIGSAVTLRADRPAVSPAVFKTSGAHCELSFRVDA